MNSVKRFDDYVKFRTVGSKTTKLIKNELNKHNITLSEQQEYFLALSECAYYKDLLAK